MLSTVYTAALTGIDGYEVTVECNLRNGLGNFDIIGLPDASVKESKERIKSAMENSGFSFDESEIIINMAPADKKKEGSSFDLAMLVSVLMNYNCIKPQKDLNDACFIGELYLSGGVRSVRGVLPMVIAARENGKKRFFLPRENVREAAVVDGIEVYGIDNTRELVDLLNGNKTMEPAVFDRREFDCGYGVGVPDFAEVKGQPMVKRAVEVAVAGGHNILMIGPPGSGKSMIAKRIPGIMPPMTFEEALESTKIHSVAGELNGTSPILCQRPFRSPHHTVSSVSLAGGGKNPQPGEISLAHNGVLFLDELPEFQRNALEVLRQPLEDKKITVTRVAGRVTYPSSFMLVCAMNPCKCGNMGSKYKKCTCTTAMRKRYLSKISGPLLDRIDIHVEVSHLKYDEFYESEKSESSEAIRERVTRAREFARNRFKEAGVKPNCNAQMEAADIERFCVLDDSCKELLRRIYDTMGLSPRGHSRILKLSRTIADLDGSENIAIKHIAEAIRLRTLDRNYWEM